MASTITINAVVDWARTQTKMVPIVGVGGFSNEPAMTIANNVIQEMLAYPYNWKFNRTSLTAFDSTEGTQEYTSTSVSNFGWLERAYVEMKASTSTPKPIYQLEVVQSLPKVSEKSDPNKLAYDRDSGSDIILRLDYPASSTVWTVYADYQKKAPLKTALGDTWSPFPDELAFVYRQGFLAMAFKHTGDPRFTIEYQQFQVAIAKALGLKDAEQEHAGFFPELPIMRG